MLGFALVHIGKNKRDNGFMQVMTGTEVYNNAIKLVQKEKPSYQELEKAFNDLNLLLNTSISEDDENIYTILFQLGSVSLKRNHLGLAIIFFKQCLEYKADFLEALNNLGYLYKKLDFSEKAREYFGKVIELVENETTEHETTAENKSEFYTNWGSMFVANGTPDQAIEIFNKADKFSSHARLNRYNRGLAYLEKGIYDEGFDGYDQGDRNDRIESRHYYQPNDHLPIWDGTPDKNIVVMGEQGIGDELMFGTIIPDIAKNCKIVIDAHPRLADMFRRSFPNLDVYGSRKDAYFSWGKRYKFDAKVQMGSLAKYYRKKESDFPKVPYLVVDSKFDKRYAEKLVAMGERPKIGISWRGGTKHTGRNHRYIPLEEWLPIIRLDCDFISLQYDPGIAPQIDEFNSVHNVKIHHWQECMEDYEQTAALVKNLDLVISVPQSVIHLSGVIGTTLTWQLCPVKTLWQSGVYGQEMPWYPNTKNYWQQKEKQFSDVLKTVREDLCHLLQMNTEN